MNNTQFKNEAVTSDVKMQASNIDEQGNVLFLDEERLKRKKVGFKRYKNQSNGLGIKNFLLEHFIHLTDKRWKIARFLYKIFTKYVVWIKEGGLKGKIYKRVTKIAPDMEKNTAAVVMPLNVDISDKSRKVVIPTDLLKETLKKVKYIGGMDECLCRKSNGCTDYPQDLGCLFLGEAGRVAAKHHLGRELTYEEACERIDRAAALGLCAHGVWIEFEQILWGVRNDMMDDFFEICFCCPCCCIAFNLSRNITSLERQRFHPSGWTAVPDRTKCVGCGLCTSTENGCPQEAISIGEDGKVVINQETCVGCGLCRDKCKLGVIKIKQTMPMREDLGDYFEEEFNVGLKIWKDGIKSNNQETI